MELVKYKHRCAWCLRVGESPQSDVLVCPCGKNTTFNSAKLPIMVHDREAGDSRVISYVLRKPEKRKKDDD